MFVPELFHAGFDYLFGFMRTNSGTGLKFTIAQFVVVDKELDDLVNQMRSEIGKVLRFLISLCVRGHRNLIWPRRTILSNSSAGH